MKTSKLLSVVATLVVGFIASCAPSRSVQCPEPQAPLKDGSRTIAVDRRVGYRPVLQEVTLTETVRTIHDGCGKSGSKVSDVRRVKASAPAPKPAVAPAPPAKKDEKAPRSTPSTTVGKAEMVEGNKPCGGVSVVLNNSTVNINSGNGTVKATPVVDDIPSEEGDDRIGTTYFDAPLVE